MKKLIALVLALALVALCAVAFADTITITLKNPNPGTDSGETLTAYKILDVVKASNATAANDNSVNAGFAYSISSSSPWLTAVQGIENTSHKKYFKLTAAPDGLTYAVELNTTDGITATEATAKEIAAALLANKPTTGVTGIPIASGSSVTAETGYYLITSPLGENLVLATTNISLTEKNDYPNVEKEDDKADDTAMIGQDVVYTINVTIPAKANNSITLNDTMTSGLTFKGTTLGSLKFLSNSEDVPVHTSSVAGYTFTKTDDQNFTIVFDADLVAAHQADTFVVTYTATVNSAAIVGAVTDANGNKNDVEIIYSNYHKTDYEPLETYKYEVVKVDGANKILTGAQFTLWDDQTATETTHKIGVVATATDGVYRIATGSETPITGNMSTDSNGKLTIIGFANGTYYLQEDVAPTGYNKLGTRQAFTIANADKTATVSAGEWQEGDKIVNQQGTELPSTGGIGTTIFYILGGLLVIGAAVILVARRKASN